MWNDANGNGVQDAGEDGINGVTVQLVDSAGNLIASAITAGDGNYSFSYLAGSYSVNVVPATLPAGVAPTYDLDGIGTPNTASVAITAGSQPDRRRLRLPRHGLHRRPAVERRQRQRCPGRG